MHLISRCLSIFCKEKCFDIFQTENPLHFFHKADAFLAQAAADSPAPTSGGSTSKRRVSSGNMSEARAKRSNAKDTA